MSPEIEGLEALEPIGQGASADVYRAIETTTGETVAVKVFRFDGSSPESTRAFLRECRASERLAALDNVAAVHRSGTTAQGHPYVVMDLATEGSLADLIARGRIPVDRALALARGVATALDGAHQRGVLHRDVKPGNVLIDENGEALLSDFGIAVLAGSAVTTTSGHPYTLAYASPEVLRGTVGDERSDVYSFGATVYEMLEGRPPFAASGLTIAEILGRTLHTPAPPVDRAGVPEQVAAAVTAMLSPDPDQRPTIREVVVALDAEPGRPPSHRGRVLSVVAATVLAVVVGAAVLVVGGDVGGDASDAEAGTDQGPDTTTVERPPIEPYTPLTDESRHLEVTSEPVFEAAAELAGPGADVTTIPATNYHLPPQNPPLTQFPVEGGWNFASARVSEAACHEYHTPNVTTVGFIAKLFQRGGTSVVVSRISFDAAIDAAQIFKGRTIAVGVNAETC
ncbi:MAG TPA: serine/threonine-protein kinase, partial [Microthrixaceae bacterium]|nr:serine/threonine-protein kinase [Microthrixaceae bacterium]